MFGGFIHWIPKNRTGPIYQKFRTVPGFYAGVTIFLHLTSVAKLVSLLPKMNRITIDPKIRFGKPCIRGTRIAVVDILHLLSAGYTIDDIPQQYPGITREDILAAIEFASRLSEEPARVFAR